MLNHALEVWSLLAVAFLVGCVAGSAINHLLAVGRSGLVQEDIAFAIATRLAPLGALFRRGGDVEEPAEPRRSGRPRWEAPEPPEPLAAPRPAGPGVGEVTGGGAASGAPAFEGAADDLLASYEDDIPPSEYAPVEPSESGAPAETVVPDRADDPEPAAAATRSQPPAAAAPEQGGGDRLVRINGLGRKSAEKLNRLGIYHFSQIAAWTPEELKWITAELGPGVRPEHDDWIGQAARLMAEKAGAAGG